MSSHEDGRAGGRLDITAVTGLATAVVGVLVAVAIGGGGVTTTSGGPAAFTPSAVPAAAPVTQVGALPLCGFPRLDQVTDDGVDADGLEGIRTVVDDVVTLDDGELMTFRVVDGSAYVLEWDREATYTVTRYDLANGDAVRRTLVELDWDGVSETFTTGSFEVDPDGKLLPRRHAHASAGPAQGRTRRLGRLDRLDP